MTQEDVDRAYPREVHEIASQAEVAELKARILALETRLTTEVAALCESVRELNAAVTELGADLETEASRGRYERSQRKVKT